MGQSGPMLTNGFDHVAVLTNDTERFLAFYKDSSLPRRSVSRQVQG